MEELEQKILEDGIIIDNEILKVDSFINHQIDVKLLNQLSKYLASHFNDVDRILTIETSGIAFAIGVAQQLGDIPVVFAKKSKSKIVDINNIYTSEVKSFTRNTQSTICVDKRFLKAGERVLIIDDFLAEGNASLGLVDLCKQANAIPVGVGIVVEKRFQGGRQKLEDLGIKVVACASIDAFVNDKPVFHKD